MSTKLPPKLWVKQVDGTMKLVEREDFLKAIGALKDHSNGFQPPPPPVVKPGLGTLLAKTLSAVGIKQKAGCNCGKRQAAMDRATPAWLRRVVAPLVQPSRQPSTSAVPASSTPSASRG